MDTHSVCLQQSEWCLAGVYKLQQWTFYYYISKTCVVEQGKSEDSCDRASNLTQIGSKSLIFQPVWTRKVWIEK